MSLAKVWARATTLNFNYGRGSHLYTKDGTKYIDFTCGIGVTNTGHSHPRVVAAIQEQAAKLLHSQINCYTTDIQHKLAENINAVTPQHLDTFFFSNSGAEAVEGGVKLAKHATGRPNVVVLHGSFHGRTHQAMAMTTSKSVLRARAQPLPGNVHIAPFPYAYRQGVSEEEASDRALDGLRTMFHDYLPADETAAVFVEPVLGEGGYIPVPHSFLRGLRSICDEHGILLVYDEVQSGFGRTGRMLALEHTPDVKPDMLLMAKGLASGLPLSCIAAPSSIMDKWQPGSHGGTYGGNPVACAAAAASIAAIQEEHLCENAVSRGTQLTAGLQTISQRYPGVIGDVRGLGLMIGCEFAGSSSEAALRVSTIIEHCREKGNLLLLSCGGGAVIRWIPPLVATKEEVDEALTVFDEAVAASVHK